MINAGEKTNKGASLKQTSVFHWSYVALPLALLLLSIILLVFFLPKLPAQLGYHFKSDGTPDLWLGRSQFILATILPQFFLTIVAVATIWGLGKLSARLLPAGQSRIKTERIAWLMGNMVTLPQIVLSFVMLEIFSYNTYQIHLMPIWVFAVIVMVIGGIILGVFFFRMMLEALRPTQ